MPLVLTNPTQYAPSRSVRFWLGCGCRTDEVSITRLNTLVHTEKLAMVGGSGEYEWEFADPVTLVQDSVMRSASLAKLFADTAHQFPPSLSSPWRLVVAFDEFAPGNKLKVDNRRTDVNIRRSAPGMCITRHHVCQPRITMVLHTRNSRTGTCVDMTSQN